jgi:hypothetical protein
MAYVLQTLLRISRMAYPMQTRDGVITIVQEHRFHLVGDDGAHGLFILAHDAPLEWQDLAQFEKSRSHVRVSYEPAPGLIACTAHDVVASQDAAPLSGSHQGS